MNDLVIYRERRHHHTDRKIIQAALGIWLVFLLGLFSCSLALAKTTEPLLRTVFEKSPTLYLGDTYRGGRGLRPMPYVPVKGCSKCKVYGGLKKTGKDSSITMTVKTYKDKIFEASRGVEFGPQDRAANPKGKAIKKAIEMYKHYLVTVDSDQALSHICLHDHYTAVGMTEMDIAGMPRALIVWLTDMKLYQKAMGKAYKCSRKH